MTEKCFDKGQVIFRQGDMGTAMYQVERGSVGIFAWYDTERKTHLVTFGPGDFFGETELIESCTRAASAVATEDDTRVQEITQEDLAAWFRDCPEKVLAVMQQVSRRVSETTRGYLDACRTVYETVETEKTGEKKSSWLEEHLSLFYKIGQLLKR